MLKREEYYLGKLYGIWESSESIVELKVDFFGNGNKLIIDKNINCANGLGDLEFSELENKNCIKVVKDKFNNAIYMS